MKQQKQYWNEVAHEKQFTTPFRFDLFQTHVKQEASILDYGCGYGRTLRKLRKTQFTNLYGVDFSEEMIKRAKLDDMGIHFSVIENRNLAFPDNYFDSVLLFAVLTCIHSDEEQRAILDEIKRVLKPNGIIYINDFLLNQDNRNLKRYDQFYQKYDIYGVFELPDGAILRHHNEEQVKCWMKGFKQLAYEKVEYTTMNGNRSNGVVCIGKLIK
ncbi:class I SAM-dependent methyltransferase [Bacillus pseudomycoides]|uniref:class I SAM-dependent methyltransferase n=1 Tax=Bacillus TaxID=1386 RepID=UPI002249370F|nr:MULTISPECIES: class I SAM-dependent methyltransferase [Bacillus]MCX2824889.1 class I SAM-dependent methyltransferase [Bacillus sp. DHT2]MDR4915376.1 class I SAM-dependent methyltransferase [Bacillus pseudomycoides]